ncbi:MAG: alanine--tRNA ligase [Chloroflexi bacterium]|nr:alanine--tRNA ligase [Chloroflexota bacterium]
MPQTYTANEIRQTFIDFFVKKKGHQFVPSSSLVPGGDATLLFTNSGMVQFKDIFLGTDKRGYQRAVNSQKCMRVAGKHNDLEDVGFDDSHHTFFEMLGNWSFGDYYKEEAIDWAWELFTEVWKLPKDKLYFTVFRDELGEIPTDDEAVNAWKKQSGLKHEHIIYLGREDNFWEMADTGPCGPNSEIHIDLGPDRGEIELRADGQVDLENGRFLELWNLVFIQFNRTDPKTLEPLPKKHVDTGLGLERIVSVLQGQSSTYRTDLFTPIIEIIQKLTGHDEKELEENFTPYRVIADHGRAAAFLIADGVVPGNMGRNYVTRMIIRRAARFGSKIGLDEPFLAKVAEQVIELYGEAYPELVKNQDAILENLSREEERFQRTVEGGVANLETLLKELEINGETILDGEKAFDLHATYGLPFEITRDIAHERGLEVEEESFRAAMEVHRLASGAGQAMGELGGKDAEVFQKIFEKLQSKKKLKEEGVEYDPYSNLEVQGEILAMVWNGKESKSAKEGDQIEIILPETCFYVAAGGQVSDTGTIVSVGEPSWQIRIQNTRRASAGMIVHAGIVTYGKPKVGDIALAIVDRQRRQDIIRNHTATHLLHAELHAVLGEHARQAGSLVAPDRLRFDFTHHEALTPEQTEELVRNPSSWFLVVGCRAQKAGIKQARNR